MIREIKNITINSKEYNYIFSDIFGLLEFLAGNKDYKNSLKDLMSNTRKQNSEIFHLVIEYYYNTKKLNRNVIYLLIFNKKEIISTSRIMYSKNNGYINFVQTNKKFRNLGMCRRNLKKLIYLMNKKFKINNYDLLVNQNNLPAIKCYQNCGFKIIKNIKKDNDYKMNLTIK